MKCPYCKTGDLYVYGDAIVTYALDATGSIINKREVNELGNGWIECSGCGQSSHKDGEGDIEGELKALEKIVWK